MPPQMPALEDTLQTTVRGIPEDLEHQLRERARRSGESLNRTLIRLLREAVGLNTSRKKRDLSALAGTWSQEEADRFDREVRQFEEIEDELWR